MTVTSARADLLTYATRATAELRWADAAQAYQEVLDNMPLPTSTLVAADRASLNALRVAAINASQVRS